MEIKRVFSAVYQFSTFVCLCSIRNCFFTVLVSFCSHQAKGFMQHKQIKYSHRLICKMVNAVVEKERIPKGNSMMRFKTN